MPLEFALGVSIGVVYHYVKQNYQNIKLQTFKTLSVVTLIIGLAGILASLFVDCHKTSAELVVADNALAMNRVLLWGVPGAIFIAGVFFVEQSFGLKIPKFFIKIGDASFSGYLVHTVVIVAVGKLSVKLGFVNKDEFIVAATILCALTSLPMYNYIEKPLLNLSNKLVFKSKE